MTNSKLDAVKIYYVTRPIHGYQTYQVHAHSKKEAISIVNNGGGEGVDFEIIKSSKARIAYRADKP